MIPSFLKIKELCANESIPIINKEMIYSIHNYLFLYISSVTEISNNKIIFENIKESNFVLIDQYKENNPNQNEETYVIVGFKKTIILISKSNFPILNPIFSTNNNLIFCFISKIEGINFSKTKEINDQMKNEIESFNQHLSIHPLCEKGIFKTWKIIISCISGYLINESYEKTKINRLQNFLNNENSHSNPKFEIINENQFIELRNIGTGSSFLVSLIYHIKKEEFFALKKPLLENNNENEKLIQREIENHTKVYNQLLPRFVGTNKKKEYIILEFINGKTLTNISEFQLSYNDKLTIIFELMMNIEFLHRNQFIFRDIKPSNIMLDLNNTAILIDFDRMVEYNEIFENFTNDFSSRYVAPEVNSGDFSYECDIYSLGKIMFYIIKSENPTIDNINRFIQSDQNDHDIKVLIKRCIEENPENRISLLSLILMFFYKYYTNIKIDNLFEKYINKLIIYYDLYNSSNCNHVIPQWIIGLIYSEGKGTSRDISKAIHYFELAADQDDLDSLYNLGVIYYEGKGISRDIAKSIFYFELAASQNDAGSQYNLGGIYEKGEFIKRDIEKAIHFYSLAADQNYPEAQFNLGVIYEKGEFIKRDIEKAIHFYSLAANQNYPGAQYNLGLIFSKGEFVERDIDKAIYYFSRAASQNFLQAQYYLGMIYIKDEFKRDINLSICYFELAANQNDSNSQYNLGLIYLNNEFIPRNINKAIKYFTLAANQNHSYAQFNLGLIYSNGMWISRDINKAIYYYSLAANQNNFEAQYNLAIIYEKGTLITRDINKAIYYYSLAANQNFRNAQFCLGLIYFKGEYIKRDIEKAIYYFQLAADNNVVEAFANLGIIYEKGISIQRDINKAIQYFLLAAKFNNSDALFELGFIYFTGYYVHYDYVKAVHYLSRAADLKYKRAMFFMGILNLDGILIPRNLTKASYYLKESGNDENKNSYVALGFLYHVGIAFKQDIQKAIKYYKEASSFKNFYAKNNLGIIYKHGFNDEIKKELNTAIIYFQEAIDQNNDIIAMYNLAHLYFYEEPFKDSFKESIKLLIKSSNKKFYHSTLLLCIISIINFGFEYENIIKELNEYEKITHELEKSIYNILVLEKLDDITVFENRFNQLRDIDFFYNHYMQAVPIENEIIQLKKKEITKDNCKNINSDFYKGFGI